MDPYSRRSLWDFLQNEKEDRTILLTTHYMEEADALGDRIAIMANGEIQCCGSPLFLKKRYGAGYHLVMVKKPFCDVSKISDLISSHVPSAEMSSNIGTELKYFLPDDSSKLFPKLFSEMEDAKEALGISGFGASITTIEEVFIKVGNRASIEFEESMNGRTSFIEKAPSSVSDSGMASTESDFGTEIEFRNVDLGSEQRNVGIRLFMQHLYAHLLKCVLHSYRNLKLSIPSILVPPIIMIITLTMINSYPKYSGSQPLVFSVQSFRGTQIPFVVNSNDSLARTLGDFFQSQFSGEDRPVNLNEKHENMTSYLLRSADEDIGQFNMHNMIGASFEVGRSPRTVTVTSWFNNQAYHTPAIALFEVHNAILKYLTNNSNFFTVTNHPLPLNLVDKATDKQTEIMVPVQVSTNIVFGLSFLIASFSIFVVRERASGCKHLQRVSGSNALCSWLAVFFWDLANYLASCCLILIVFAAFQLEGYATSAQLGRVFLLLFVHGFAAIPFTYSLSFLFKVPSTALTRIFAIYVIAGTACLITVSILEVPSVNEAETANVLDYIFCTFFPFYNLGRGMYSLYQNYIMSTFCNNPQVRLVCAFKFPPILYKKLKGCCKGQCGSQCLPWQENYLSVFTPGIGKELLFLAGQVVIFSVLLYLCEINIFRRFRYDLKSQKVRPATALTRNIETIEDEDVKEERLKVKNALLPDLLHSNHLVLREVSKNYGTFSAVDRISFGVQKGECFGLLGLNGAGKTTTFKMITGDENITSGQIYVCGFKVGKESEQVQGRIGYCPQFDALLDQLTGRETLALFARLRGIPERLIPGQILNCSEKLHFQIHLDKEVKDYSGGNKRKLSTAIALLGDSPVLFLDEPTSGMDPVSRRRVWNVLLEIIQSGYSVILTTHSMEECEALCHRLVIMVNGKLCCLGSPQHLKDKFGEGFTLVIKVSVRSLAAEIQLRSAVHSFGDHSPSPSIVSINPLTTDLKSDIVDVKEFVERTFHSAVLKHAHGNLLLYHIPNIEMKWSEMFRAMEEAKSMLNIEDYSIGQTSLEQVFINFAMTQQ